MQKTDTKPTSKKQIKRIHWSKKGDENGPVLVLFVGIHGNEPAGVKAVNRLSEKVESGSQRFKGTVYGITGNIEALKLGVRFLDTDLNRLWELFGTENDFSVVNGKVKAAEYKESLEIKETIDYIIEKHKGKASEFVFADLHTTSSQSCAFILLNDSLANRKLARRFPVPQVLGIEENIHGTLLSYINNLGHKAIGFEAGAHTDEASVRRSEAFLWLLLDRLGIRNLSEKEEEECEEKLDAHPGVPDTYYEVKYHKIVDDPMKFDMLEGFQNFDEIEKDQPLAHENNSLIKAPTYGRIFMPLYQKKGHDGFLIIREVPAFWLKLSGYLRRSFVHKYLEYLPGVTKTAENSYEVDLRIARYLVKDIFHLLGYRVTEKNEHTLLCHRR